jgi:hypothetical protein
VNDPQVKKHTPRKVVCAACDANVKLEGDGEYNLAAWDAHKASCHRPNSDSEGHIDT